MQRIIVLDEPPGDFKLPRIGPHGPGNNLDERRFARPILADQSVHLPGPQRKIDPRQRPRAAERLADASGLENNVAGGNGRRNHDGEDVTMTDWT